MVVELFQKLHLQIYASQFMTSQIIPLPLVLLCLEVWKGREKINKSLKILRMKRAFKEIKNNFHSFGRAIIRWKNKNFIKNRGHKL